MKTIEITVSPDGQTRLETKGFAGPECQKASRFLRRTLGKPLAETRTSDFFITCPDRSVHVRDPE